MDTSWEKFDKAAIEDEGRRVRAFRFLTDLTLQRLLVERITLAEAWEMVAGLRNTSESIFPGKTDVFDLVLWPRMERVIRERFGLPASI